MNSFSLPIKTSIPTPNTHTHTLQKALNMHFLSTQAGGPIDQNSIKRLRRILKPRSDGSLLVPKEILEKWTDNTNGGREAVLKLWERSDGNKDPTYLFLLVAHCRIVEYTRARSSPCMLSS